MLHLRLLLLHLLLRVGMGTARQHLVAPRDHGPLLLHAHLLLTAYNMVMLLRRLSHHWLLTHRHGMLLLILCHHLLLLLWRLLAGRQIVGRGLRRRML